MVAALCVCLCVRHTFCQRNFTVDSLKDADLRKDVPFGGLDDESPPKTPILGAWIGISSQMWKIQIAITSDLCIRLK